MHNYRLIILIALITALAACSRQSPPPADFGPPTKTIHLQMAGADQAMAFRRYRTQSFPLAFFTYVPVDMQADEQRSNGQATVTVHSAFGGDASAAAGLTVVALPESMRQEAASKHIHTLANELGGSPAHPATGPGWARQTYRFHGEHHGYVALGRHNRRWFYVLVAYPPGFGQAMQPQVDAVLNQWRWWDDGAALGSSQSN